MRAPSVQLSSIGPIFSQIVFGTMRLGKWGAKLDTKGYREIIDACLEQGITTFDHADIYGDYTTEGEFGKVLKETPSLRDKIQLVTKCGINMVTPNRPFHKIKSYSTTRDHIIASAENSLRELNTDRLELLLIHRPSPLLHPDEVASAFEQLKRSGKVLHFGVSNFSHRQFLALNSRVKLVTNQIEISALKLDHFFDGFLDLCLQYHIRPMAWSPLGGGAVFAEHPEPQAKRVRDVCHELMERHNAASIDQILYAFLFKHPAGIFPVIGTTKKERIKSAISAWQIKLTDEEWFEIWQASKGEEVA